MTSSSLTITAIIATYNEADVIARCVEDLVSQGISVIILDDGSVDGTMQALDGFVRAGTVCVEPFQAADPSAEHRFSLTHIIARKQQLATQIAQGWFINHDADEFRESPWLGVSLAEGIRRVDALGYNAIDFQLFNFWPTGESYVPGDDPRDTFPYCEPGATWDRLQIRCWKHDGAALDLVSSAGHEAVFPGRRVFPTRFILRHYPFRGHEHAERKLFRERRPQYDPEERSHGWHLQYDALQPDHGFVRDRATLRLFEPVAERIQLQIHHRLFENDADSMRLVDESAQRAAALLAKTLEDRTHELEQTRASLHQRNLEVVHLERALDERTHAAADFERRLDVINRRAESLDRDLDVRTRCADELGRTLHEGNLERRRLDTALDGETRRANDLEARLHQCNLERGRLEQALEMFRDAKSGKTWRPGIVFRKLLRRPENDGSDQL